MQRLLRARVHQPRQFPFVLDTAVRTAIERRGVAVLVVPGDLLVTQIDRPRSIPTIRSTTPVVRPSDGELDDRGPRARRGRARDDPGRCGLRRRARTGASRSRGALQAPIVHTLRGKEFVEHDNPFDVGMTGLLGFMSGYHAMMECDALLMLGTDFPYREFYPERRDRDPGRRAWRADRPAHGRRRRRSSGRSRTPSKRCCRSCGQDRLRRT